MIVAVGAMFRISCMFNVVFIGSDHKLLLSCTSKVIVCEPVESVLVLNQFASLKFPSILDFHLYAAIVPSVSDPWPLKATVVPSNAGFGKIESIVATGALLDVTSVNFTASAHVLGGLSILAVIVML